MYKKTCSPILKSQFDSELQNVHFFTPCKSFNPTFISWMDSLGSRKWEINFFDLVQFATCPGSCVYQTDPVTIWPSVELLISFPICSTWYKAFYWFTQKLRCTLLICSTWYKALYWITETLNRFKFMEGMVNGDVYPVLLLHQNTTLSRSDILADTISTI